MGGRIVRWLWWPCYLLVAWVMASAVLRVRIRWRGGLLTPPAIVVGKHASYWDVPLLGRVVRRVFGRYPAFEMGTFEGYALLGRIDPILKRIGGFPVMRSKDVLRLKHTTGRDREELSAVMRAVNDRAAATRREVLERGDVLCYFPEGTRNAAEVGRLRSRHEMEEAITFADERGVAVSAVPVVVNYGPRPKPLIWWLRRREATIEVLDPIDLKGREATDVLDEIGARFRERFVSAAG